MNWLRRGRGVVCLVCLAAGSIWGQRVERTRGEHLIAVVPLIGAGTMTDPLRPMFVPNPNDVSAGIAEGQSPAFLSCHYVMTDDGHSAIVEYVASTRSALQPVLDAAAAGTVSVFEPRSSSAAAMLQQLRQIKAGFTLRELRGGKLPRFSSLPQQNGGSN